MQKNVISTSLSKLFFSILFVVCLQLVVTAQQSPAIKVSENKRFFQTTDGKPFFWLGDTGWLLFAKTNRDEAIQFLDTRKAQGFNVVQVMVIHSGGIKNAYGKYALCNGDVTAPIVTPGTNAAVATEYDYWDHVEFIIQEADKRGIYMALVPLWGSAVKEGKITPQQGTAFAKFLADRFKKYDNIVWLNGGDIRATEGYDTWQAIGRTLRAEDPKHLITYHPRGRYSSSEWFHNESWLDFNMFQSGHKNYSQDTTKTDKNFFGEDNWRFIKQDLSLSPAKPTFDGEPSYENIPHGLHDSLEKRWTAADLRRYAYWSVLAGGAGFTYGENAVMQFHTKGDADANYGVTQGWKEAINAPGALQMKHLKDLILSFPYFERVPAQEIIADNNYTKYDYIIATKGPGYAMAYTYTGRDFSVDAAKLGFKVKKARWFNPSTGVYSAAKYKTAKGLLQFDPAGNQQDGNDWVLVLQ